MIHSIIPLLCIFLHTVKFGSSFPVTSSSDINISFSNATEVMLIDMRPTSSFESFNSTIIASSSTGTTVESYQSYSTTNASSGTTLQSSSTGSYFITVTPATPTKIEATCTTITLADIPNVFPWMTQTAGLSPITQVICETTTKSDMGTPVMTDITSSKSSPSPCTETAASDIDLIANGLTNTETVTTNIQLSPTLTTNDEPTSTVTPQDDIRLNANNNVKTPCSQETTLADSDNLAQTFPASEETNKPSPTSSPIRSSIVTPTGVSDNLSNSYSSEDTTATSPCDKASTKSINLIVGLLTNEFTTPTLSATPTSESSNSGDADALSKDFGSTSTTTPCQKTPESSQSIDLNIGLLTKDFGSSSVSPTPSSVPENSSVSSSAADANTTTSVEAENYSTSTSFDLTATTDFRGLLVSGARKDVNMPASLTGIIVPIVFCVLFVLL